MLLPRSRSCNGRHDSKLPAILLIDEVDSFLQDRRRSAFVGVVGVEWNADMESYQGVFIASTNLMSSLDVLDSAALRRFVINYRLWWQLTLYV